MSPNDLVGVNGSVFVLVASSLGAFGVSFFSSLTEASLLSITPGQLAALTERHGRVGSSVRRLKENLETTIAAILILNTAAHTVGATVAGAQFALLFGHRAIGIFSGIFTFIMLQYTEMLPKSLGIRFYERVLLASAAPLAILTGAMAPLVYVVNGLNRPFSRQKATTSTASIAELLALAGHVRESSLITVQQERIVARAVTLFNKSAADMMVPVDDVAFLHSNQTLAEAVVTAHLDPHTRFPVTRDGDRDNLLGYINFKELVYRVRTNPVEPTLPGVVRPVRFVGQSTSCQQILSAFVDEHEHMAIVRNQAGKTLGLVTLEDLVEQFLGELGDEFDALPQKIHALSSGVWLVGGGAPVGELAKQAGVAVEGNGSVCLSDYLTEHLGHTPSIDERLTIGQHELLVRRMRRGRVFEVLVSPARSG